MKMQRVKFPSNEFKKNLELRISIFFFKESRHKRIIKIIIFSSREMNFISIFRNVFRAYEARNINVSYLPRLISISRKGKREREIIVRIANCRRIAFARGESRKCESRQITVKKPSPPLDASRMYNVSFIDARPATSSSEPYGSQYAGDA